MGVTIKPSDLQYKYPRNSADKGLPKFQGKPDPAPFDRNDLWEILPMFEAVMDALDTNDGRVVHKLEEVLNTTLPGFVRSREEVFDFLLGTLREILHECR